MDAICYLHMLGFWDIGKGVVFLALRDRVANIMKGLALTEVRHLSCFANILQLVVKGAIWPSGAVKDLLTKFRNVASHFRHFVLAKHRLSAIQRLLRVE